MVPRWTNDRGVSGSNPSGAPFEILDFVRDLLFPLLKNSKSDEESCPYFQFYQIYFGCHFLTNFCSLLFDQLTRDNLGLGDS